MKLSKITKIVFHHSASPSQNLNGSMFAGKIEGWHKGNAEFLKNPYLVNNKKKYTQYHFLISGDGKVINARPITSVGWHAGSWITNIRSVGICFAGDFRSDKPTSNQIESSKKLVRKLILDHNISPDNVAGHRDFTSTICPGQNFPDGIIRKIALDNSSNIYPEWAWDSINKAKKIGISAGDPTAEISLKEWQMLMKKAGVIKEVGRMPRYRALVILDKLGKL